MDQDGHGTSLFPIFNNKDICMGMEVIRGDRKDEKNPFYWDSVVQNYPGTYEYDSPMPGLYLWDSKYKLITAACKTFVDDSRSVVAKQELSRDTTHHIETVMDYLGLQDATGKRCP